MTFLDECAEIAKLAEYLSDKTAKLLDHPDLEGLKVRPACRLWLYSIIGDARSAMRGAAGAAESLILCRQISVRRKQKK